MECRCEENISEDAATGLWLSSNSVQMGAFTVVGYLLYRFSQTLPALIRWPIRLFCCLTGLSTLWSWVIRLVRTIRVIQTLLKWMSKIWRSIVGSSKDGALQSETDPTSSILNKPGLRLILLGPAGEGRSCLSEILLGKSETRTPVHPPMESVRRRTVMDGREVTVINTPDLLGPSLGNKERAMEALRSLQLASPGPHALLLEIRAPSSNMGVDQDAAQALRATVELFGDAAVEYTIPIFTLTHAGHLGQKHTVDQLLHVDVEDLNAALSPCSQTPELVDGRPHRPPEAQSVVRKKLMGRVMEVKTLRGHFIHEMQRREDVIREELLADMASGLARKLGHV